MQTNSGPGEVSCVHSRLTNHPARAIVYFNAFITSRFDKLASTDHCDKLSADNTGNARNEHVLARCPIACVDWSQASVVLPDIAVCTVEQLMLLVQSVLEQRLSQHLPDFSLAGVCGLPALEADLLDDLVDVVDDPFDHDGRLVVTGFLKQFAQGGLAAFLRGRGLDRPLSLNYVAG